MDLGRGMRDRPREGGMRGGPRDGGMRGGQSEEERVISLIE